jgi:hypothetical protein
MRALRGGFVLQRTDYGGRRRQIRIADPEADDVDALAPLLSTFRSSSAKR